MVSGPALIAALLLQDLGDGQRLVDQRFEWRASHADRTSGPYGAYAVALDSGKKYVFEARSAGGGNTQDPYLFLRHPFGFVVAADDDGGKGLDASLTYAPQTSGIYTLYLRASLRGRSGTCTLSMSSFPIPPIPPGDVEVRVGDALRHQPFAWTRGERHEGEYAQYSIRLDAGQRVVVETSETRGGTTGDAVLYLLRGSEVLAFDDDSGPELQARLAFEAPSSGTYRIRLRPFSRGAYGTCTLTLKPDTSSR